MNNHSMVPNAADFGGYLGGPRPSGDDLAEVGTIAAIRRHWLKIAAVVVVSASSAYALCSVVTPSYLAQTTILLDLRNPKPKGAVSDSLTAPPQEDILQKNELAVIRSRSLAEAVVASLSLDRDPEFNRTLEPPSALRHALAAILARIKSWLPGGLGYFRSTEEGTHAASVDEFLKHLSATSGGASRLIEIGFQSTSPQHAVHIADAIAEQYILQSRSQILIANRATIENLEQAVETLNERIRVSERKIDDMRQQVIPNGGIRVITEQLSELDKQLAAATAHRTEAEAQLAELEAVRGSHGVNSAGAVLGSQLIQRLQETAALLAAKTSRMEMVYGDSYPELVKNRGELNALHARIEAEVGKIAISYQKAALVAKSNQAALQQAINSRTAQLEKVNASEVELHALERTTDAKKAELTSLVDQLNTTREQINLLSSVGWIISKASLPRSPVSPPTLAVVATVFMLSAVGSIVIASLLVRNDVSIRSLGQLRHLTDGRALGAVPIVSAKWGAKKVPGPQHALEEQTSLFSEQLRAVWFRIKNSRAEARALLITSSVSGEGKTSIATSFARMQSLAGRRVAIIDGDLRNPNVHRVFGLKRSPGLTELIRREGQLEDVLQVDEKSGACVITAGAPVPSPADTLQSPMLARVIGALSENFDLVILDSPPVLAVHDAAILARTADCTVMVVRWGRTRVATFLSALQQLSDFSVLVDGVVLSMVDSKKYIHYSDSEMYSRGFRRYYIKS